MARPTTDDVEDIPHLVILRTNGRVLRVEEFKCGTDAHVAATRMMLADEAGEIIVCMRVRTLESGAHAFRHTRN